MKVTVRKSGFRSAAPDLLVIPVLKEDLGGSSRRRRGGKESALSLGALDGKGSIKALLKKVGFQGKAGSSFSCLVPEGSLDGARAKALLFTGAEAGKSETASRFDPGQRYRALGSAILDHARKFRCRKVALSTHGLSFDVKENLGAFIEGLSLAGYSFEKYRGKKAADPYRLNELEIWSGQRLSQDELRAAQIRSSATSFARDLVNMSGADCTPSYLVRTARGLARKHRLRFQSYNGKQLTRMGANSLVSVSAGSDEDAYLIKLTYRPKKRASKVISLVGKGITFDSGGLSIKTGAGMQNMKCDMAGAAAVLATMQAIAALKPRVEVRAYIPTAENMINGNATRPGDVVRAMNKKTIEILNTDAEGRLILADALVLAEREKCDLIVDLATLTGACVVALGMEYAGCYVTDRKLAEKLKAASEIAGERLWEMPLAEEYKELIKSSVADMKNTGGQFAGSITAALFLREFVEKTPWAHLDIAGPAFTDGAKGHITRGGVGFGVRTLCHFLLSYT